ncbi:hypothetical protein LguiA_002518 [Lonicera macranthoides]
MKKLEILDLSRNQLFGVIPIGLGRLNSINVLDLSSNNFPGKIPRSTKHDTFNVSMYAGNDKLCGLPLPRCPKDESTSFPPPNDHGKAEDIFEYALKEAARSGICKIFPYPLKVSSGDGSFSNATYHDHANDYVPVSTHIHAPSLHRHAHARDSSQKRIAHIRAHVSSSHHDYARPCLRIAMLPSLHRHAHTRAHVLAS